MCLLLCAEHTETGLTHAGFSTAWGLPIIKMCSCSFHNYSLSQNCGRRSRTCYLQLMRLAWYIRATPPLLLLYHTLHENPLKKSEFIKNFFTSDFWAINIDFFLSKKFECLYSCKLFYCPIFLFLVQPYLFKTCILIISGFNEIL